MRLLRQSSDGELSWTKDLVGDDEVPPYAILSHTWQGDEEVTFEDLMKGSGKTKSGYAKIRFCAQQAKHDGLLYFWVDTCCINKANYVELQDAINSMFRWYQNAVKCYVFLSDVSASKRKASSAGPEYAWEAAFRASRWFTRGWTVQELLAPRAVMFFSREGKKLGDKRSLERQIYETTGIAISALQATPLHEFSVEERLQWTENRQTTRKEDKAYSLLGIFNISMSTNYGEGEKNAFKRLREEIDRSSDGVRQQQRFVPTEKEDQECIKSLRITDPRNDKSRIEETKGGLLKDSYRWILDNADFQQWRDDKQSRLLWIKGDPGKGKTMLLCGIIDEMKTWIPNADADLLSYFFCQATDSRINSATAVLRGLMYLLISQQPSLISYVRKRHDHAGKALFQDANTWVALTEIFTDMLCDPSLTNTYLIIDALDECITDLPKLLDFIVQKSAVFHRVKWIISSRNKLDIEERFRRASHKVCLSLELNAESISKAVSIFIKQKVSWLAIEKKYNDKTRDAVQEYLASNAHDTFLWVALVCQNLKRIARWNVLQRLNTFTFPPGLDSLYEQMMEQISHLDDADICKQILALVAIVYRPVTLNELATLVEQVEDMDPESTQDIISLCGSFLTVREDIVYFVHQSAKDFLLEQASRQIFPSSREGAHFVVFSRSLQAMSGTLRRDIYHLRALGFPIDQIKQPHPDPLATSRYSCIYWVDHLCASEPNSLANYALQEGGVVDVFLRKKYLYWLEALSLCKGMSKGVVSMAKLEALVRVRQDTAALTNLIQDARQFIMYHKGAFEVSPLQAYGSALLFSPRYSLMRGIFNQEEPKWVRIKPDMRDQWSACLQTLEGHSDGVTSVVFSHDSTWLASGSGDNTIKIWDASSGECLQTLEGHSGCVWSVAFSHDSTRIASGSVDNTVKIWEARTGECAQTLEGHSNCVWSVAFSDDSTQLASGSSDTTIKIWDMNKGVCLQTLVGHSNSVNSVAFSHHDSTQLASGSDDNTIKIWDVSTGECLQTLKGHSHRVRSVAFSYGNSTQLASGSDDTTIKIWDVSKGECLQTLEGHSNWVWLIAFSHDSAQIASGSIDATIKIWDVSSGECIRTLRGHSYLIRSIAFSHDSTQLASGSDNNTVEIWDPNSSECSETPEGHSRIVRSVAFSHDSTRLVSGSVDKTIKIWHASSGDCLHTLEGHSHSVCLVAFSHDSTLIASGSDDNTIKIWDVSSGECLQTLRGHSYPIRSIAFSHDSTQLASGSSDYTIKIWDTNTGKCLQTLRGHSRQARSVAFSDDSTQLASGSEDTTIKIWDVSKGECLQTLEGHSSCVWSVTFSHDSSTRIASGSDDNTIKIWDVSSGECLQTLKGRTRHILSFNTTGSYLFIDTGCLSISGSSILGKTVRQQCVSQDRVVRLDQNWITYGSKKLLWVPSEHRASSLAVSGEKIGVGTGSGRVWICSFDP